MEDRYRDYGPVMLFRYGRIFKVCVCMSVPDTQAPVSVSGRLEKESTRCWARVKADENEMQNHDSRLRHKRAEV